MSFLAVLTGAFPELVTGLKVTLQVFVGAAAVAAAAAFLAGPARLSSRRAIRWMAGCYVEVFRGTSALVQLFWLFFVLPLFGITLPPFTVGILGLGLCIGAYGAEVVRGAILAVPAAQVEAARALGLSPAVTRWRVVMPQAMPLVVGPFGNLAVELLKLTSLVSLVTLQDLTFQAQTINTVTMRTTEIFLIVMLVYFALSQVIAAAFRSLSRHAVRWRPAHVR